MYIYIYIYICIIYAQRINKMEKLCVSGEIKIYKIHVTWHCSFGCLKNCGHENIYCRKLISSCDKLSLQV